MYPTAGEQIQQQLIQSYQQPITPRTLNFALSRYSQQMSLTPKQDHPSNYFFNITEDDQKYRRNLDQQKTDPSRLTKRAQKIHSMYGEKHAELYNQSQERLDQDNQKSPSKIDFCIPYSRKQYNLKQNDKVFYKSEIFQSTSQKLNINNDQIQTYDNISQSSMLQSKHVPLTARSKSPIGALSNKLYNSKIRQYPDSHSNVVNLEVRGELTIDSIELKRQLALQGVQLVSIDIPFYPITNKMKKTGNIKVRIDPDLDLEKVRKQIEGYGLASKNIVDQHPIKTEKSAKTWLRQKIAYKNMGFFANRDYDRVIVKKCETSKLLHNNHPNDLNFTPVKSVKSRNLNSPVPSQLHQHLHQKKKYNGK